MWDLAKEPTDGIIIVFSYATISFTTDPRSYHTHSVEVSSPFTNPKREKEVLSWYHQSGESMSSVNKVQRKKKKTVN